MVNKKLFEKHGFKKLDAIEFTRGSDPIEVPHPKPDFRLKLIYQTFQRSIEEIYFWMLMQVTEDWGLHEVVKIQDVFSASEQSSFWGASQQRLQIQQTQVSQYLGTVAQMIKSLFQIVREIKLIKERLIVYRQANDGDKAAEVVLKGFWIDLKEGGSKNPTSVYGMATQVGFAILPDLFFSAPLIKDSTKVDAYIKKLSKEFNEQVCKVLGRKLKSYSVWRENTFKEHVTREGFTVKYLRQHYDSIQMYMGWIKPYLKNVKRLQMNQNKNDSADLIGGFEGSVIEIEVLCHKKTTNTHNTVMLMTFEYRTRPGMDYRTADYQHKGPSHLGKCTIHLRAYAWKPEQIENYKRMREEESMELLSNMDESLNEAMKALGGDLRKYLKEAGEDFPEDKIKAEEDKKKAEKLKKQMKHQNSIAEPFIEVYKGFAEIFGTLAPLKTMFTKEETAADKWKEGKNITKVKGDCKFVIWQTYKNFKGNFGLVKW